MDVGDFMRAGLYDPEASGAATRLELLEYLVGQGVTIGELVDANREGRLPMAAAESLIRGGRERLTLTEVCERA